MNALPSQDGLLANGVTSAPPTGGVAIMMPSKIAVSIVVVAGAVLGMSTALPIFGYPPAYLAPVIDDRSSCQVLPSLQAQLVAGALNEWARGPAPVPGSTPVQESVLARTSFAPARCGRGIEAWGSPLGRADRQAWTEVLRAGVSDDGVANILRDQYPLAVLHAEQEQLELTVNTQLALIQISALGQDAADIATAVVASRDLTAALERQRMVLALIDVHLAGADDPRSGALANYRDFEVNEPPEPYFQLGIGATLGALSSLAAWTVLVRRRSQHQGAEQFAGRIRA